MRALSVVLNARAGALRDGNPSDICAQVSEALGGMGQVDVVLEKGPAILRAIDRAAQDGRYDALIVGGGDGSVNYAVQKLVEGDKALGVIPLGTMNLLARDLGFPTDLKGALSALASTTPRRIDLGVLNGMPFHSLSGIGFFSQMARAREEARDLPGRLLQVGAAAIRAFMRSGRFLLDIEIDGAHRSISTYAVLVTCNRFGGQDWRRDALDGGALEIHIAQDEHAFARLKAGADLLNGSWRENSGIESRLARRIVVRARRHRAFVSTDGERRRESLPLHYEVKPRSLTVLAPNGVTGPQ